ncbi:MAG: universal stress protein [Thermoleophilia bacterium]
MSDAPQSAPVERIVVALDASPQSVAALRAAVELAVMTEAEVEGLFVEDIDLIHLCGLPFGCEVGSFTAEVRRVDAAAMERQLRGLAAGISEAMAQVAAETSVSWSFSVRRGVVVEELVAAAQGAALMTVGRAGRGRRRGVGSTAEALVDQIDQMRRPLLIAGEGIGLRLPLTVLYTGTPAARRALDLALRLTRRDPVRMRVVAWANGDVTLDVTELEAAVRDVLEHAPRLDEKRESSRASAAPVGVGPAEDLLAVLKGMDGGTLLVPREQASLVSRYGAAVLLVP